MQNPAPAQKLLAPKRVHFNVISRSECSLFRDTLQYFQNLVPIPENIAQQRTLLILTPTEFTHAGDHSVQSFLTIDLHRVDITYTNRFCVNFNEFG
jgi:hypothetical protein